MTPQLVHLLFTLGDALDRVTDELPGIAEDTRITLSALARACQLTAQQLQCEAAARERRLMEPVK